MSRVGREKPRAPEAMRLVAQAPRCARVHTEALSARHGPTWAQFLILSAFVVGVVGYGTTAPESAAALLRVIFLSLFGAAIVWRLVVLALARPVVGPDLAAWEDLPSYTVVAPLYRESGMAAALLAALERLDYPRERLQIILALECDDLETRAAVARLPLPPHFEVLIVPPGSPRTKPRACNAALAKARGERLVVYDAEDRPHPGQLREAAARFHTADPSLACLQSPLRVDLGGSFTMRQFSLEYAALFELTLPALARLGAPFPLGGTSNHFRTDALRQVGGWDSWNVTEDADVGFRLASAGYRLGVLRLPTFEDAPRGVGEWLPQRSRWLKGYMQTWGVHTRRPWAGGLAGFITLQATVGLSILSAVVHAPTALLIGLQVATTGANPGAHVETADLLLFGGGWAAAALSMSGGARRAGFKARLTDALFAPVYWSLQSLAFWRALIQLFVCPHHWDKTPHHPPEEEVATQSLDELAGLRVGRAA